MIPQSFIQDLLSRVDIVEVVGAAVPLKRAGTNLAACCPFHNEKSPSFTVSPTKQFYHCFGCGAHGTAISFLMEYHGMGFIDAVKDLAARAGMTVPDVFVLSEDDSINALAAGKDVTDAAIVVTRGAVERLDREQLQALVAHEFSHIQNGDMATNTQMIAWIAGLVVLSAGQDDFTVGLVGLTVMGIAHVVAATTVSTSLQMQVDDAYRGRAAVAHMQGILLGVGLGALVLAQIAEATSLTTMELAAAGALVVFLVVATPVFGRFRLIDNDAPARTRLAERAEQAGV